MIVERVSTTGSLRTLGLTLTSRLYNMEEEINKLRAREFNENGLTADEEKAKSGLHLKNKSRKTKSNLLRRRTKSILSMSSS